MFILISECDVGYYGLNCEQICNEHNCRDGAICNHDNGHCPRGCQPGYMGPMCMEGLYHLLLLFTVLLFIDQFRKGKMMVVTNQ